MSADPGVSAGGMVRLFECMVEYLALHNKFDLRKYAAVLRERLLPHAGSANLIPQAWPRLESTRLAACPEMQEFLLGYAAHRFMEAGVPLETHGEVSVDLLLRLRLQFMFHMGRALEPFMGRVAALEFFKNFVDYHTTVTKAVAPMASVHESIMDLPPPFQGSFNALAFGVGKAQAGVLITRCRWHEALAEFDDPEWAYAVACHYDFVAARTGNENFHLTRTRTCAHGDGCCDFVWHDLREEPDPRHPDEKFWNEKKARLARMLAER